MSIKSLTRAIASRLYLASGGSLDAKRPRAWCEYGFPETLCFDDFFRAYKRADLANGAVTQTVEKCWQTNPWLIQGDPTQNKTGVTGVEAAWARLFKDLDLWAHLADADRRRLVGRYSGLLLLFADDKDWDAEVQGASRLVRIEPIWANQFKPLTWHDDPKDAMRFGTPETYTYTQPSFGGSPTTILTIHADRLFVLGALDPLEPAYLEPGFNQLVTLEKITGGSGESILKNAARQLAVEFDKEISFETIAAEQGTTVEALRETMDEQARDLGVGVDALMAVVGGSIKTLTTAAVDPRGPFEVAVSAFAASIPMPVKVLIGMQTGERASTEDRHAWNALCQGRRIKQLTPDILRFLRHLERVGFLRLGDEVSVMWDDLQQATRVEQLTNAKIMAETNQLGVASGAPYYKDNEVREAGGYDGDAV